MAKKQHTPKRDPRPLHERVQEQADTLTPEQGLTLAQAGQAWGHHRGVPGHKATEHLKSHPQDLAALGQAFVDLAGVIARGITPEPPAEGTPEPTEPTDAKAEA